MTKLGLPVPPGFTITTEACKAYMAAGDTIPDGLMDEVAAALRRARGEDGQAARRRRPTRCWCRCARAPPFSMPGMMDTVLNLGLNDVSVGGLAKQTDNERFACDSYRRFVQMFGKIVLDIDGDKFEHALERAARAARASRPTPSSPPTTSQGWSTGSRRSCSPRPGIEFPQDPKEQLAPRDRGGVPLVERRARAHLPARWRRSPTTSAPRSTCRRWCSATRATTPAPASRSPAIPATGENRALRRLPDERAGRGRRRRHPRHRAARRDGQRRSPSATSSCSSMMQQLEQPLPRHVRHRVHHRAGPALPPADARRQAHRRGRAADGRRDGGGGPHRPARGGAARRSPTQLDQLLHPQFDPTATYDAITKGLNASPGAAVGKVYFTADDAEQHHDAGEHVILVRPETSPDDLHGMIAAEGILTSRGGLVSHAAVVARGMGTPAVCGASELDIDVERRRASSVNGVTVREGDVISINGTTGEVVIGAVPVVTPEPDRAVRDHPRLGRRVPPHEGAHQRRPARTTREVARRFGAEGIGLCRTEHMFLGDRLPLVQRFILADDAGRGAAPRSTSSRSSSAPTSRGSSRRWTACPSPSGCSTRRCTSSSPTSRSCSCATRKGELDDEGRQLLAGRAALARGEPDARHAWRAASASSSPACTGCRPRRSSRRRSRASTPAATRTSRS